MSGINFWQSDVFEKSGKMWCHVSLFTDMYQSVYHKDENYDATVHQWIIPPLILLVHVPNC